MRGIALAPGERTFVTTRGAVEARTRDKLVWRTPLATPDDGGPIAVSGTRVIAAFAGRERVAGEVIRGEPGAALVGLEGATGAVAWRRGFEASDWVVVTAMAPIAAAEIRAHEGDPAGETKGDGVIVGGAFSGTLRIGDRLVSAAGKSDGFVAAIDGSGAARWLVRVGGPGADGVNGVAVRGELIAIAGTFSAGAELAGQVLPPYDDKMMFADGFVAALDGSAAVTWVHSFGGSADDAVSGVAIDREGRVAIAGSLREVAHVAGTEIVAHGTTDGLVAWWSAGGSPIAAMRIGGHDIDGTSGIAAVGDRFLVGGYFSGKLPLASLPPAPASLLAAGGDDAYLVAIDPVRAKITRVWHATGDGREEIAALVATDAGFAAVLSHTAAAQFDGAPLASPADPMAGGAIVVRGL